MNITDLIHSFFGGEGAARLGQAAGLDRLTAQRALGAGLPLHLDALAEHARTPEGQAQLTEAVENLPRFASVAEALDGPDGAQNLAHAGELLGPALLGHRAGGLSQAVAEQAGIPEGSARHLLGMALPLLLSVLGQAGVNGATLSGRLGELQAGFGRLGAAREGNADPAPAMVAPVVAPLDAVPLNAGPLDAVPAPIVDAPAPVSRGADGLLEFLRGQFAGETAERIGTAAGFSGSAARRATQAALPLVLNALIHKGRTGSGAADLLTLSRPFEALTRSDGHLNTALLADAAESARIEGQGRSLLGGLFGNVEQLSGRLGTALGGSGASAGRLLALLTPLVLGVLGGRLRAGNLSGAGLSSALGGLGSHLAGLLPSGMSSLSALLGAGSLGAISTASSASGPAVTRTVIAPVPPSPPLRTEPTVRDEAATTVTTRVAPARRRGGFPWWLIPLLLLLLLGGCWLVGRRPATTVTTTTTGAASGPGIVVTNPASGENLPAAPFTMSGTAPAGTELTIQDQGQPVRKATVGADGNWSADLPAPTTGEHTYTIEGGQARSEFKVTVADAAGTADPATGTGSAGGTDNGITGIAARSGAFTITAPQADAKLPAGGFTLSGTGQPGQELDLFEDVTGLGKVKVGQDGTWSFAVPSPSAGLHRYVVRGPGGTDLGAVSVTVAALQAGASAANCTKAYTLSIGNGQTVREPFRFGGVGSGRGYSVTVRRGERTIGTKNIPLDATCGWSYQSKPGAGTVSYEVRPLGDEAAKPLSRVTLTVRK